jgi:hypothetical protein
VQVADGVRTRIGEDVAFLDVHAAGKRDASVDDQHLAVIAELEERQSGLGDGGQEEFGAHARLLECLVDGWPGVAHTHTVDQHAHRHAALHRARQGVDETPSRRVVGKDVRTQAHRRLRGVDCREHFGVGGIAVDERRDLVACHELTAAQVPDDPSESHQVRVGGGHRTGDRHELRGR